MSVVVTLSHEDGGHIVPVGAVGTVAALGEAIHEALGLPHPASAYEMRVGGGDADIAARADAPLADVGIHGDEELVVLRVKYTHVARAALAEEGIATHEAATAALREAVTTANIERARAIAAAGLACVRTHVSFAIYQGLAEAALAVLEGGGEALAKDDLQELLAQASLAGMRGVVSDLIARGVDVDAVWGYNSIPLHNACNKGHEDVVVALLDGGADVQVGDASGHAPLYAACRSGHKGVAEVLVARGADVKATAANGWTALHAACDEGHRDVARDVAEWLLDCGADVDARSCVGETPLWVACLRGRTDVAELLLDRGADVNAADDDGLTAYDAADSREGLDDVKKLLVARGALQIKY